MLIQLLGLLGSGLALLGCRLNNKKRIGCFALWIISNAISAALHCLHADLWPYVLRDLAFLVLAIEGWREWGKQK